jgi:hypothetical protein
MAPNHYSSLAGHPLNDPRVAVRVVRFRRIDPHAATEAYQELLKADGLAPSGTVVLATTNYDVIGESVLELLVASLRAASASSAATRDGAENT